MSNMPDGKPSYQGKAPAQISQGNTTEQRKGKGDPKVLRHNEPKIPADRKLGSK